MPRTPSPTKRRRVESTADDDDIDNTDEVRNEATPRPTLRSRELSSHDSTSSNADNHVFSARDPDSISRTSSQSTRSTRSSRSSQSQNSRSQQSPVKRDLAMRFARDLPIQYRSLSVAPKNVQDLAEQLAEFEGKQGIMPECLQSTIQAYRSPSEPIKDYMFDKRRDSADSDLRSLNRELERLLEVRDNTLECNSRARVFHEVEWNETVHSPMLRLVTKRFATLACRNLCVRLPSPPSSAVFPMLIIFLDIRTQTSLAPRWANTEVPDSRVDYGIFVAPKPDSDLYSHMFTYIQQRATATGSELGQINPLLDIDIDRPLAVAIETKRLAAGVEKANTQLASFGRSMLRFKHDVATFLAKTRTRTQARTTKTCDAPFVLPLVIVIGVSWEVDFMVRENGLAVIYGPVSLGSTQTLTNCYRLYRSLDVLFQWSHEHCVDWWTGMLQPSNESEAVPKYK
ncbi:hypothetical protein NPX13_g5770 [Xylaria arbuscula]|uniref:PD-(D/E)XK nuclease-like domain-containing protein n=1 Tax=Xylaria arbuscula TaxID=114810 RepID=A0A9W8NDE6_9PEZI|nr:hypothetical protein NPX13_g5770 [Xylaria arbuscula]